MSKLLTDEQVDSMMRALARESAADQGMIAEIADSPATWWSIQRRLNTEKATTRSPWPPAPTFWRLLFVGAPVATAVLIAFSLFVFRSPDAEAGSHARADQQNSLEPRELPAVRVEHGPDAIITGEPVTVRPLRRKTVLGKKGAAATNTKRLPRPQAEIKSDFIALSYAPRPDSGQIVRVRVPRSMMVTVGLVSTVERPSALVNAEVVVGDDGQTHAIRFIK